MTTLAKQENATNRATAAISNVESVTDALTEVLADTYRLVLKSRIYHWNVTGPQFVPVHDLTEEQHTDMFAAADVLPNASGPWAIRR